AARQLHAGPERPELRDGNLPWQRRHLTVVAGTDALRVVIFQTFSDHHRHLVGGIDVATN
ncbi:MAG: hypothetical protein VW547_07780, partial [Alphaproteobacteria bacterium]